MPEVRIEEGWKALLEDEFTKPYFKELSEFVRQEYAVKRIFPPARLIFNAFDSCPLSSLKVVIIGQDPYHGLGQAHGLSFSVPEGIAPPPSLINIFREIESDLGIKTYKDGNLMRWVNQGVLLLNATLTVEENRAGSHQGKGWEKFTDAVISQISSEKENIVFLLWGNYARQKGKNINRIKHLVLETGHPSPLSANRGLWFGNRHFSQTNKYLSSKGLEPIDWR